MTARLMYSSPLYEGNMSRVRLSPELDVQCMNSTTGSSPACDRSAQGISLSTPILMTTFGVFGNVLALIVLYSSRREAHARRTVFFVMLAGLAWTDLIGQLAVSPIAIITYANNLRWIGGDELCRYHGFMMVSFGVVMPLIVCCMSVERLLAIKFSYYYAKHVTRRKAQITFLASWCLTTLFSAMPFIGFGSYELQFPGSWCFLNFHRESKVDTVYAIMFSSVNIIFILIMIVCNLIVAGTLFRIRRSRHLHSSPSIDRRLSASGIGSTTSGTVTRARRHSDMEAQMIWFLCLITVAFSVCWLPLNVHILLMQFTDTTNRILDLKFIRMASCNQILDPWLYVIFRKNSLLRIMRRLKTCLSLVKQAPKNGNAKATNMRYVISNKSYTYEATSLGKTVAVGHYCLKSPSIGQNAVQDGCEKAQRNECSGGSSNSVTRLMSVCSYCDRHCSCLSGSNHIVQISPGVSPYASQAEDLKYDFLENNSKSKTPSQHDTYDTLCLAISRHGISEPLLDITTVKPKNIKYKFLTALDHSISSDSSGGYYSLDSKHQPSVATTNHCKPKNISQIDMKQKKPLLGSSKSTSNSERLLGYSQTTASHSMSCLNNVNLLLVPPYSSPTQSLSSWRIEEQNNLTTDSRRGNQNSYPASISFLMGNITESPNVIRNEQLVANHKNQTAATCDTMCLTVHKVNDSKVYMPRNGSDSPFVYTDNNTYLSTPLSSRESETLARHQTSGHYKPRSYNGGSTEFFSEDFHLRHPLKSKPTFSSKLFSTRKTNKIPKNSPSIVGTKLGSSNSLLQNTDHSDHIKCFKSKKNPTFLGKNGHIAYQEGNKAQTNGCEHGILELSVGSCP